MLYVTKAEFDLQMSKNNQEIDSIKKRLRLGEEKIDQTLEVQTDILWKTQNIIASFHDKLAALTAQQTLLKEDNPTEEENKSQEKKEAC